MRLLTITLLILLLIGFGSFVSAEQYYEFEYNVVRAYEGVWNSSVPYFVPNPAQTEPTVFPTTFYFYEITHNIAAFEGLKYIIVFPSPYPNLNYGRYYFVEAFTPLELIDGSGNHWIYSKAAAEWGGSSWEMIIKINADGTPDFSGFANSNALDGVSSASSVLPITLEQATNTYRCFEQSVPFNPNPAPPPVNGIADCQYANVLSSQPISGLREIDRVVIEKTLGKYLHKWTGWNPPAAPTLPPVIPVSPPPVANGNSPVAPTINYIPSPPSSSPLFEYNYRQLPLFPYQNNVPSTGYYLVEGYRGVATSSSNTSPQSNNQTASFEFYHFYYNGIPVFMLVDEYNFPFILTKPTIVNEAGSYHSVALILSSRNESGNEFASINTSYNVIFSLGADNKINFGRTIFTFPGESFDNIVPLVKDTRIACISGELTPFGPFRCDIRKPKSWSSVTEIPENIKNYMSFLEHLPNNMTIGITQQGGEVDIDYLLQFSKRKTEIESMAVSATTTNLDSNNEEYRQIADDFVPKKVLHTSEVTNIQSSPVTTKNEQNLLTEKLSKNEKVLESVVKLKDGKRLAIGKIESHGKLLGIFPISFVYEKSINVHSLEEESDFPWWAFLVI